MNILALDLSLRGPAAVIIPTDWVARRAPLSELRSWRSDGGALTKEASENDKAKRDNAIALWIWRLAVDHDVRHAFIEDYAFSKNNVAGTMLHELGGVVRHKLAIGLGLEVERVTASVARKHFFGAIKRSAQKSYFKDFVGSRLAEMGLKSPTEDEDDALVIANYGLALLGAPSFVAGGS